MTNPQQPSEWSDPNVQPPPVPPPPPPPGDTPSLPSQGYATPPAAPYPQPGYPGYGGYGGYGQPVVASRPTNGLAIASMIVSILGLGPIGAIMGHIARRQIRERGEEGDGFALAGIIVGWVTTAIWVLCCGGYAALIATGVAVSGVS